MKLLAVVDSPLQLLNARECRYRLSSQDEGGHLCLIGNAGRTLEQMRSIAEDTGWGSLAILPRHREKWRLQRHAQRLLASLGTVDEAMIGELRSDVQLHLGNRCRPRRLWLLDDGTANITAANDWLAVARPGDGGRLLERFAKQSLFDLDCLRARRASWFTAYPEQRRPGRPIVHNDYRLHRQLARALPQADECWCIGSPLCEKRGLGEGDYRAFVRHLLNEHGALAYVPHRFEDRDRLARLAALPGLRIHRVRGCIEHAICTGSVPRRVVGAASSAFISLRAILGDSVALRCHAIRSDRFPPAHAAFMQRTQAHLATVVPVSQPW